jgi:hypothetical protein
MVKVSGKAPETKVGRQIVLLRPPGPGGLALVRLTAGKGSADYLVRRVTSHIGGAGFEFVRRGEVEEGTGRYHVLLAGAESRCECRGHLRWGTECKHLFCARVLLKRGWL